MAAAATASIRRSATAYRSEHGSAAHRGLDSGPRSTAAKITMWDETWHETDDSPLTTTIPIGYGSGRKSGEQPYDDPVYLAAPSPPRARRDRAGTGLRRRVLWENPRTGINATGRLIDSRSCVVDPLPPAGGGRPVGGRPRTDSAGSSESLNLCAELGQLHRACTPAKRRWPGSPSGQRCRQKPRAARRSSRNCTRSAAPCRRSWLACVTAGMSMSFQCSTGSGSGVRGSREESSHVRRRPAGENEFPSTSSGMSAATPNTVSVRSARLSLWYCLMRERL